jgi:hypothetical protein
MFISHVGLNSYSASLFGEMVYGESYRPFVCRALVPLTVRYITEITPPAVIDGLEYLAQRKAIFIRMMTLAEMESYYVFEYLVYLVIAFICYFGFILVMRQFIKELYDFPDSVADIGAALALLFIPAFFRYCNYIYDPATIFLFALASLMIIKQKRVWFYVAFILAVMNKETSILLIAFFFIYEYKSMRKSHLTFHLFAQLVIWFSWRLMVTSIYADNIGGMLEFHLLDHNLTLYIRPMAIVYMAVVYLLFFVLLKYNWDKKPAVLRKGFWITFIPIAVLSFFFGFFDELRMFYEVYIFAYLLAVPTIVSITRKSYNSSIGYR